MTFVRFPYASGRSPVSQDGDRPFAGIGPTYLIPLGLLSALVGSFAFGFGGDRPDTPESSSDSLSAPSVAAASLPSQFTPAVQQWAPEIQRWAADSGLPATWIATVIQIESCGHPFIRSRAGAIGLFQVMPFHFEADENPIDIPTNAARGLSYLSRAFSLAQGQLGPTLAGYNGGHGLIGQPQERWPEETQRYVQWGTGIVADVEADIKPSPTLVAWLNAGGRRLCRQAEAALGLSLDPSST